MSIKSWSLAVLFLSLPVISSASEQWLIVAQSEMLNAGEQVTVEAIKPESLNAWPEKLQLKLFNSSQSETVELFLVKTKQYGAVRRTYAGIPKGEFTGIVRAELENQPSNRLLMMAEEGVVTTTQAAELNNNEADEDTAVRNSPAVISLSQQATESPISANEPLYFIFGSSRERNFDARFQLSFKYRPFDPDARVAQFIPYASNLYFAYTQTSIWDLGGDSSPFKDTSYRPSVYYNWLTGGHGMRPDSWKTGFEHESNGRGGEDSRSMNMLFAQPFWNIDFAHGRRLTLMPKFYHYVEKADNTDIGRFRGYVDWQARYGREDGAILTGLYRQGAGGYAMGQLDLSYPISDKLFGRTGTFVHLQLLGGYGETLIDYNRTSDTQLRIGISLAR